MGSGNFDARAYKALAEKAKETVNSGFTATSASDEFNPSSVSIRYSKKGPFNEFRDPITVLIGLDVTGSMDVIPKSLLEGRLGTLMVDLKKTFSRPNENLQISFAGIGDAKTDQAPLQVTHFESDNRFAQQLQKIWLEGGGGGNGGESYNLLWWYAAKKTHLNYVDQDKRKGILITIGDDNVHDGLTKGEIQAWLDPKYDGGDVSNQELLKAVREQYEVYHIVITDGQAYIHDFETKREKTKQKHEEEAKKWADLLEKNNVIYSKSDGVADAIAEIVKRHRPLQRMDMLELDDKEWSKRMKENLTESQWVDVLRYAVCPLSRKFMDNPVEWGAVKRACQKEAVVKYVEEHKKDPITQQKITLSELVLKPNINIAQLCTNYRPFFEALSESQREHLIEMAFPVPKPAELKKSSDEGSNPRRFFSSEDEAMKRVLENAQVSTECPILHTTMKDPVILVETGQSYERSALEEWFKTHSTDPLSPLKELKSKAFIPNIALRNLCEAAAQQKVFQ